MSAQIEGKVAAMIDKYTVAINVGLDDGVREGMKFKIVAERGEVKDPDTQEVIGRIQFPKASIEVTHVERKISIAQSSETYIEPSPMLLRLPSLFEPITRRKELPISEEDLRETETIDRNIKVGDKVVQILTEPERETEIEA